MYSDYKHEVTSNENINVIQSREYSIVEVSNMGLENLTLVNSLAYEGKRDQGLFNLQAKHIIKLFKKKRITSDQAIEMLETCDHTIFAWIDELF